MQTDNLIIAIIALGVAVILTFLLKGGGDGGDGGWPGGDGGDGGCD